MKMAGMSKKDHEIIGAVNKIKMAWDNGLRFSVRGLRVVKLDWDGCYKAEGKGMIRYSSITGQALRLVKKLENNGWVFPACGAWRVDKVGKKVLN